LVVDSAGGRLYLSGEVNGVPQIVALAASGGRLLASYGITGTFAVDPVRGRLYVDRKEIGLSVLDAKTGAVQATVFLPHDRTRRYPAPKADPVTGLALAFRDNVIYFIDPDQGAVGDTISFDVPKSSCGSPAGLSGINWAELDSPRRLIYLKFTTYTCTPHYGETLVSYDLDARAEITRQDIQLFAATASDGYLYGSGALRMGYVGILTVLRWAWRDGQPWQQSEGWVDWADLYVDSTRGRLYEAHHDLRVLDAETLNLLLSVPKPVDGDLVGYDPATEQLYFLSESGLHPWPVSALGPPSPEPPQVSAPPSKPLRRLFVSPTWPQDKTLFGLWDYAWSSCYDLGGLSGLFYLSGDGGDTWAQPRGGLRGSCERVSTLAVSPGYARDRTILAGIPGLGVLKSTDGGQSWPLSSAGLSHLYVRRILLSPDFERDQTAFVLAGRNRGTLYRSLDGGATWQPLDVNLGWVAMSPEFGQDQVLMGISFDDRGVLLSRDKGDTWERVGEAPEGISFGMLSVAPQFQHWQVVFAYGDGSLYHSTNGGHTWNAVLSPGPSVYFSPPQFVYGPATDQGRQIFLLATTSDYDYDPPVERNTLYYSENAVEWQIIELPSGLTPTSLALSPDFARDGLLFVGSAEGRVVALEAGTLDKLPTCPTLTLSLGLALISQAERCSGVEQSPAICDTI
jgi:photosystem II stability/assembly factor-like uncharacterized protein